MMILSSHVTVRVTVDTIAARLIWAVDGGVTGVSELERRPSLSKKCRDY
jgi:hypothetical protein